MFKIETYGYHKRNQYQSWGQVAQAADVEHAIKIALMHTDPVKVFDPEGNLILERGMDHDRTSL